MFTSKFSRSKPWLVTCFGQKPILQLKISQLKIFRQAKEFVATMQRRLLLLFILTVICTKGTDAITTEEVPDNPEAVAESLVIEHYDCSKMQDSRIFALNKVKKCEITPENIETSQVRVTLFYRSYKGKMNAKMCSVKHKLDKYWCGHLSHTAISHDSASITKDLVLTPEMCEEALKTQSITLTQFRSHMIVPIEDNKRLTTVINQGVKRENEVDCDGRGFMYKNTFITYMQDVELSVDYETKKVVNHAGQILPCKVEEGGCESTSLDPYAYTWTNDRDGCVLLRRQTVTGFMVKLDERYYIIANNSAMGNTLDFKIEVMNEKQHLCKRPNPVYKTNFETLFIEFDGGFDMNTGRKRFLNNKIDNRPKEYHIPLGPQTSPRYNRGLEENEHRIEPHRISVSSERYLDHVERNNWEGATFTEEGDKVEIDYDFHLTTKIDYVYYYAMTHLRNSELALLERQCELERTQLLTTLMLAMQNNRLAGYMITGNRSAFLETDGNVAFIYHCPKFLSPIRVLDRCTDRIPVFHEEKTYFVDAITRQTFDEAREIDCSTMGRENAFQLNMENDQIWYKLTPTPQEVEPPEILAPTKISRITKFASYSSTHAGMYTTKEIKEFWDKIVQKQASNNALQKFSQEVVRLQGSRPEIYRANNGIQRFYVDSMISPEYLKNTFIEEFGRLDWIIRKVGAYFGAFILFKVLIDIFVIVYRAFQIHQITGGAISFGKVFLAATYNLFYESVTHSLLFNEKNKERQSEENAHLITTIKMQEASTDNLYPKLREDYQLSPTAPLPPP